MRRSVVRVAWYVLMLVLGALLLLLLAAAATHFRLMDCPRPPVGVDAMLGCWTVW